MTLENRIVEIREALGLSQRALATKVGTSQQQISRIERGQGTSPGLAAAIARALGKPMALVFPGVGRSPRPEKPEERRAWMKRVGFDLDAPAPTWHLDFHMKGFAKPFCYLVDPEDANRVTDILEGEPAFDFFRFDSLGRSILVSIRDIQRMTVREDATVLIPGVRHGIGKIEPEHGYFRLYLRGERDPIEVPGLEMDLEEVEVHLMGLENEEDTGRGFLRFEDADGDTVLVRVAEIVLCEVPSQELLDEMPDEDRMDDAVERGLGEADPGAAPVATSQPKDNPACRRSSLHLVQ